MISHKEIDMVEDLLVDELKKVVKKGELKDATEAKAVKEVLESLNIIQCLREDSMNPQEEQGYSGYHMPRYSGGWGHRMPLNYGGTVDFNGTYSGARGSHMNMNGGYSGHSIHDRMIAALEPLYDNAKSEHERSEIDNWIARLRKEN